MNNVTLLGRVSSDIDLNKTQSGISVCSFNVAINNGKDSNGNERPADFIPCKAWRQTAEFISRYFSKGKMIALTGKFKTDKYQHRQYSDLTIYSSYVLVDNVEFCGDKSDAQSMANKAKQSGIQTESLDDFNDDMPF